MSHNVKMYMTNGAVIVFKNRVLLDTFLHLLVLLSGMWAHLPPRPWGQVHQFYPLCGCLILIFISMWSCFPFVGHFFASTFWPLLGKLWTSRWFLFLCNRLLGIFAFLISRVLPESTPQAGAAAPGPDSCTGLGRLGRSAFVSGKCRPPLAASRSVSCFPGQCLLNGSLYCSHLGCWYFP